jgi:hypothetical protein
MNTDSRVRRRARCAALRASPAPGPAAGRRRPPPGSTRPPHRPRRRAAPSSTPSSTPLLNPSSTPPQPPSSRSCPGCLMSTASTRWAGGQGAREGGLVAGGNLAGRSLQPWAQAPLHLVPDAPLLLPCRLPRCPGLLPGRCNRQARPPPRQPRPRRRHGEGPRPGLRQGAPHLATRLSAAASPLHALHSSPPPSPGPRGGVCDARDAEAHAGGQDQRPHLCHPGGGGRCLRGRARLWRGQEFSSWQPRRLMPPPAVFLPQFPHLCPPRIPPPARALATWARGRRRSWRSTAGA